MSKQSKSSKNVLSNFKIINEQMQILSNIFTIVVNIKINRLRNELRQLLQTINQSQISTFLFYSNDNQNDFQQTNKN